MAQLTQRSKTVAVWMVFCLALAPRLFAQEQPTPPPSPTDEADIEGETEEAGGNAVQDAAMRYIAGDRQLKLAEKNTAKLASAPPEKRAKLEKQIKSAYEQAEQEFLAAIQLHKKQPKAYAALGDVWRQTGREQQSLQAYAAALAVSANDVAALAGRSEAYLALGQIPQAKGDYDNVAALDKKRAAVLRTAMRQWLEARRAEPAGLAADALADFETWLTAVEKNAP